MPSTHSEWSIKALIRSNFCPEKAHHGERYFHRVSYPAKAVTTMNRIRESRKWLNLRVFAQSETSKDFNFSFQMTPEKRTLGSNYQHLTQILDLI